MSAGAAGARTWTLLEVLGPAAEFLAAAGIESARYEAELMLARVLGLSRLELYLQYERALDDEERGRFRALLKQRRERVPLQLVLGDTEFYSLPFAVAPGVFIPRPETEVLVEKLLARLERDWSAPRLEGGELRGLELGCGSGVIAVSLAKARQDLRLWAGDVSSEALVLSRKNAELNGVGDRLFLEERDGLPAGDGEAVHFVVSNPPYVRLDEADSLPPEVSRHDPSRALFGGVDGLDFYRRLCAEAPARLLAGGVIAVEIGADQGQAVRALFAAAGFTDIELLPDYAGRDRVVLARVR